VALSDIGRLLDRLGSGLDDGLSEGQRYAEDRPAPDFAGDKDLPAVLLDDAVGQGQTQSRSLAHGLGGEEGVEDLLL
jgi:hypothetical protein